MKRRIVFLSLVLCMIISLAGCGEEEAESKSASLAPGEKQYSGHTSYDGIEDLRLSFVLSADKSNIHDITIFVNGLKASKTTGNTTTEITADNFITSVVGEMQVDYSGETEEIKIQESTLKNLRFEGSSAYVDLDYSYASFGGTSMEVYPFGISSIELKTDAED